MLRDLYLASIPHGVAIGLLVGFILGIVCCVFDDEVHVDLESHARTNVVFFCSEGCSWVVWLE